MATYTATFYSYQATFIDSGNPDYIYVQDPNHSSNYCIIGNNTNDQSTTYDQSGAECVSLYSWHITIPTNAFNISATVSLNEFYNFGETIGVYGPGITMLNSGSFDATVTTWNNQPSIDTVVATNPSYQVGSIDFSITLEAGAYGLDKAFALNTDVASSSINISSPSGWGAFLNSVGVINVSYQTPDSRRRIITW